MPQVYQHGEVIDEDRHDEEVGKDIGLPIAPLGDEAGQQNDESADRQQANVNCLIPRFLHGQRLLDGSLFTLVALLTTGSAHEVAVAVDVGAGVFCVALCCRGMITTSGVESVGRGCAWSES